MSRWFLIHRTISHPFGDIRVILDMSGCSCGLSGVRIIKLMIPSYLIGNLELLCTQCRAMGAWLSPRGKTDGFYLVAALTWGIFSSFDRDGHWKLMIVQRRQDSSLFTMDTSGIYTKVGRTIWMILEVSRETKVTSSCTMILGFLIMFKNCQASLTFEALNYVSLSTSQRDVRPPVQMRWRPRVFCRVSTCIQTCFHLVIWRWACI